MQTLRIDELWDRVLALADAEAPAWTGREQVYLVRLDLKRFWVSAQPNWETREVTNSHF